MTNKNWIWLDMDGTFADLYSVENWLEDLIAFNPRPYQVAKSMYNDLDLMAVLCELKMIGYNIGVISWGSKAKNDDYDKVVRQAKMEWLSNRGYDLVLDKIIVTQYGKCKADTCRQFGYGILVDDEEQNRNAWDIGETINANQNIINALTKLLYR